MADLTDTEIVAACARAMGLKWIGHYATRAFREQENWAEWPDGTKSIYNPLTDRAQAMELVEKLKMFICRTNTGFWETYALGSGGKTFSENLLRAICLCAARVQIEKEKNA